MENTLTFLFNEKQLLRAGILCTILKDIEQAKKTHQNYAKQHTVYLSQTVHSAHQRANAPAASLRTKATNTGAKTCKCWLPLDKSKV